MLSLLLKLSGITKNFGGIIALAGVDLSLESGSLTCIIGPNGCGKTTLFNVITGAFPPTAGNIHYEDEDITGLPAYRIARRGIARKFQVPGIYPSLTVAENFEVASAARSSVKRLLFGGGAAETARQNVFELTNLQGRALVSAAELAHGEKQRLEIGMLMACNPKLILLDEPTAGMTLAETQRTADLILTINREHGKTILVIEHDMHFVRRLACRVIVMMRGRVFRDGTYEDAQADPEVRKAYLGEVEPC
jgi:urea transport system ATP-binding protein